MKAWLTPPVESITFSSVGLSHPAWAAPPGQPRRNDDRARGILPYKNRTISVVRSRLAVYVRLNERLTRRHAAARSRLLRMKKKLAKLFQVRVPVAKEHPWRTLIQLSIFRILSPDGLESDVSRQACDEFRAAGESYHLIFRSNRSLTKGFLCSHG